nr:unnamed protein product [Callosobruchus analis]
MFNNLIVSCGITQIIATRVTSNSATLLDLILLTENIQATRVGTIPVNNVSDHELVYADILISDKNEPHNASTYRDIKKIDLEILDGHLRSIPWYNIYDKYDIDDKVKFFNDNIFVLMNLHAPLETCFFKKPYKLWITDNIKWMIQLQDSALAKSKRTRNPTHWKNYTDLKNSVTSAIQFVGKKDKKRVRKAFSDLNILHKEKYSIPPDMKDVNVINYYFISSVPQSILQGDLNYYAQHKGNYVNSNFKFKVVDEVQIVKILFSIASTAIGDDGIHINSLIACCPFILKYLAHICVIMSCKKKHKDDELSSVDTVNIENDISKMEQEIYFLKEIIETKNNFIFEKDKYISQLLHENKCLQEHYELLINNIVEKDSIITSLEKINNRIEKIEESSNKNLSYAEATLMNKPTKKPMKTLVAHLNIRSLFAHLSEFRDTFNKNDFDFLALSETWLNEDTDNTIVALSGYNLFRSDRNGRGGGVAIYARKNTVCSIISVDTKGFDELWLTANISGQKYAIGVIYKPPNYNVYQFASELEDSINIICQNFDNIILSGDFNIDVSKINKTSTILLNNLLESYDLIQLIDQPTRITATSQSIIDIIICSKNLILTNHNETEGRTRRESIHHPQCSCCCPTRLCAWTPPVHYIHVEADDPHFLLKLSKNADDTQLPSHVDEACHKVNNDLSSLYLVSLEHSLYLNPRKSVLVLFGKKSDIQKINNNVIISINGTTLTKTDEAKNLGLVLDSSLIFEKHISLCVRNAIFRLKQLYSHKDYLSQNLKRVLCDSLVLSIFNYCDVVYGPCLTAATSQKIQRIQNVCLRFIYGIRKKNALSHKWQECQWLNMKQRLTLHSISLYNEIIEFQKPSYFYRKLSFRTNVHNLNLRFSGKLTRPIHRAAMF